MPAHPLYFLPAWCLTVSVGVHVRVAAVILRLRWVTHAAGVAPARLVPQVIAPVELARPFFYHAIIWIAQEKIGGKVAVIVAPPDIFERGGVIINPAACPAGNAR